MVYFSPDPSDLALGDSSLAGKAVGDGAPVSVPGLSVDFYAGPSGNPPVLLTTTEFDPVLPGRWMTRSVSMMFSGTVYFQVQVHDFRDANAQMAMGHYGGTSVLFGGAPGLNSYLTHFWPDSTFDMPGYGAGAKGAIELRAVPRVVTRGARSVGPGLLRSSQARREVGSLGCQVWVRTWVTLFGPLFI